MKWKYRLNRLQRFYPYSNTVNEYYATNLSLNKTLSLQINASR